MPAAIPALIAAGGAVAGGVIASKGAKSAAQTGAQAAADSNATNLAMFDKQVELQAPFRDTGLAANNRLAFLLGLQGPTAPGAAPSPQMLASGADGVFSPAGMTGGADLGGTFRTDTTPIGITTQMGLIPEDQFNAQAYLDANPDVAAAVAAGQATPYGHYLQFGQHEQRSLGNTSKQVFVPSPATAAATVPGNGGIPAAAPTANGMAGFGSLNQPFSQADYQADGAPKIDAFTNPNALPTFNEQAPGVPTFAQRGGAQQIDQYRGAQALGTYQGTPQLGSYQGAQTLGQYTDRPDLSGFEDMPAFNADMMQDDPGYQFRLNEGQKAISNSAAAKGGALSGAAVKAAQRFGQDYASNEFGNSFNRYQTTRGNKLQDYLTNQGTSQLNRNNALQTYTTNRDTSQLNNQNDLNTYTTNRQTAQQNGDNMLRDFTTNRDTLQLNNTNELASYGANRQTQQQNIDNRVRDFNDNLGVQQQNYQNQRAAYDTSFNQAQVNRTNAVNDNKDAMGVYSLNRANALQDYDAAYQRFQGNRANVINPLLSLLGAGQTATAAQSSAAQNYGNQASAAIQAGGNARAAGQVGSASAINGSIGTGTNRLMDLLMQRQPTSGGGGVTPPNPFATTPNQGGVDPYYYSFG